MKQAGRYDCMLVCVAMAAGLAYEQAQARFGEAFIAEIEAKRGTYDIDIDRAFAAVGFKPQTYKRLRRQIEGCTAGYMRNLLWGRRALVQVRSKNVDGGMHIVYWDGMVMHDPSNASTYQDWQEVEPVDVWLFNEVMMNRRIS